MEIRSKTWKIFQEYAYKTIERLHLRHIGVIDAGVLVLQLWFLFKPGGK